MPEIKIVYLPFASLVPSVNNSNTHPPEQVAQIAESIKRFGFNIPIAIDANKTIIAGEGRYLAAKLLAETGGRKTVPTVSLAHLSEAEQRAYIIADNQIARNSEFDWLKLRKELGQLLNFNFDISSLGFSTDQLDAILGDTRAVEAVTNVTEVAGHTRTTKVNPEVKEPGKGKTRQLAVLVMCTDADHQEEIFNQLSDQGLECKNTVI